MGEDKLNAQRVDVFFETDKKTNNKTLKRQKKMINNFIFIFFDVFNFHISFLFGFINLKAAKVKNAFFLRMLRFKKL